MITTRIITKYDYGDLGQNIQHHGQAAPLLYDMTRIPNEFPIFLSYGGLDRLSEVTSEHVLLNHLQNHDPNKVVVLFREDYAQIDFFFCVSVKKIIYDPMLALFQVN